MSAREPRLIRHVLRPLRRRGWILPRLWRRPFGRVALVRLDRRPLDHAPGAILGFAVVRDDREVLRRSLQHHRKAGIERFFVVDNGSTDGTREFLRDQGDVHLFETRGGFQDADGGVVWLQALLDRYGEGHWCVCFDADECLVWPGMEHVGLQEFLARQDVAGARTLLAVMIDMYPQGPLADAHIEAGETLLDTLPWYDPGPYAEQVADEAFPWRLVTGGMRGRVFFGHDGRPNLTKMPLLRWRRGMKLVNKHRIEPVPLGTETVALLHFKYHAGFARQVDLALARRSHFRDSVEYRYYKQALERDGALTLRNEASACYRDTAQLVAHDLMRVSPDYAAFLRDRSRKTTA